MLINGLLLDGLDEAINRIEEGSFHKVVVEAPTGLRRVAVEVANRIKGPITMVSGASVWGSCDVTPIPGAAVIHIGHAVPPNIEGILRTNGALVRREGSLIIIEFEGSTAYLVPAYYMPSPDVEKSLAEKLRSAGAPGLIAYALPYKLYAEELARAIGARIFGPFTGCFFPLKVKEAGVVAGGLFYPFTVKIVNPDAKVLAIDPHRIAVEDVEGKYKRFLALKLNALMKSQEARRVAVLVTSKPGQSMEKVVGNLLASLREMGIEPYLVYGSDVGPDLINELDADAVVNTACPRLGFDDLDRVNKPVINMGEIEYLRGGLGDYSINRVLVWPGNSGK